MGIHHGNTAAGSIHTILVLYFGLGQGVDGRTLVVTLPSRDAVLVWWRSPDLWRARLEDRPSDWLQRMLTLWRGASLECSGNMGVGGGQ